MKLALVAPPQALHLVESQRLSYHLVLAQYVLPDPVYADFYHKLHDKGDFIMLDNGAAENGHSLGIDELLVAAERVHADEIVMPDVLDEAAGTLMLTQRSIPSVPRRMRAVVPQGRNWAEWEYCATQLVTYGCVTICVAKRYEKLPGGRVEALRIIKQHRWAWDHNIHLLGCSQRPLVEIGAAYNEYYGIRGIDTGAPIAYAQAGRSIDSDRHASLQWQAPFNDDMALSNIRLTLGACQGET